jgi:hypothetical protein
MKKSLKGPKDWLHTYSSNIVKYGKECCSEQSITFHYTSPSEMIEYSKLKDESNLMMLLMRSALIMFKLNESIFN